MNTQLPTVEWIVAENDGVWERICAPTAADRSSGVTLTTRVDQLTFCIVASVALSLFLLAGAGAWVRGATQAESEQSVEEDSVVEQREGSLETPSFIFHFWQNDAAVVIPVAARIETLYTTMRENFGLPQTSPAEKLIIEVSLSSPPEKELSSSGAPRRISVSPPLGNPAPDGLTDAEVLEQLIPISLLEYLLVDAARAYSIEASWMPILLGLRLWQVWDLDLPLAVWRKEIVQWLYTDLPASPQRRLLVLPETYTALCAAHKLWMPSPIHLQIPLVCDDRDQREWEFYWQGSPDPLVHLNQLAAPMPPERDGYEQYSAQHSRPGKTIAVATLIEYAVTVYGQEHLPALVAGLGQHESWETLIPAVYGVSAADFEAGWQAYLVAHYGL